MGATRRETTAGGLDSALPTHPDIRRWLLELAADYRVLVPAVKDGNRIFREIDAAEAPVFGLSQQLTVLPAKKAFLPPSETLFDFRGDVIVPAVPLEDTIIFGLHVCELSAYRLLTANMEYDRADFPYLARRSGAIVAGVSCRRTAGCFCEKTGHDRVAAGDFDLFLELHDSADVVTGDTANMPANGAIAGSHRLLTGSAAGRELARGAPLDVQDAREDIKAPPLTTGASQLWPLAELPGKMRESLGATMWDELAARCLGCGNCTIVCPLCYCFYIRDETSLDPASGRRLRQWDSCQLIAFARVAGGHNFREARSERIWYRFSHKFMRTQETLGQPGCSGCGACFHFCPVDIDPREVIAGVLDVTADA